MHVVPEQHGFLMIRIESRATHQVFTWSPSWGVIAFRASEKDVGHKDSLVITTSFIVWLFRMLVP